MKLGKMIRKAVTRKKMNRKYIRNDYICEHSRLYRNYEDFTGSNLIIPVSKGSGRPLY